MVLGLVLAGGQGQHSLEEIFCTVDPVFQPVDFRKAFAAPMCRASAKIWLADVTVVWVGEASWKQSAVVGGASRPLVAIASARRLWTLVPIKFV